jgi:hypothetical protein
MRLAIALILALAASIAYANTCRTTCETYGNQEVCTTRCSDGTYCRRTCETYGTQVSCRTTCH